MQSFRLLAGIISDCHDPKKLAIACHDIGQYIENNPHGKK